MKKEWIPCDFDCLNCPRPDCDAPTRVLYSGKVCGEMTKAINKALRPTAYEKEREERRKAFEAAYFEKQKEETKMTKERLAKMTEEEREEHRRKQRAYQREWTKKKKDLTKDAPAYANEEIPQTDTPPIPEDLPFPLKFCVQDQAGSDLKVIDIVRAVSLLTREKKHIIVVSTTKE